MLLILDLIDFIIVSLLVLVVHADDPFKLSKERAHASAALVYLAIVVTGREDKLLFFLQMFALLAFVL